MSIHSTIEKIKYEFLHLFRKLRDIDSRLVKQEIKLQNIELIKKTENTKLILDTKAIRALIASLREEIEALYQSLRISIHLIDTGILYCYDKSSDITRFIWARFSKFI